MKIIQKLTICVGFTLLCSLSIFPQKYSIDFNSADSSKGDLILAGAGDKKITAREFIYGYEFGPSFPKKVKDSKEVYLNYLINEKLLASDGYSRRVDTMSIVKDNLSGIESDLATEELFKTEVLTQVKISDDEINAAVGKKLITIELKWLFAPNKDSLSFFNQKISSGLSFDSIFRLQLNDSVFEDQRKWNTDLFDLEQKSSMIAGLIKNQKVGSISSPVKGPDGYYIFKIINIWKEALPNETELNELKEKSGRALQKTRMDSLSDQYVRNIFINQNPQINGKTFDLLRTYLAKNEVSPDKFNEWKLDEKLNFIQLQIDSLKKDINSLILVEMKSGTYSFKDFIDWLRYREQLIKFNETDFNSFSKSIESYIWRMVRDNSLTKNAYSKGYQNKKTVQEQLGWWKDKIVYAIVRDEIVGSPLLNNTKESFKFENKPLSDEANKKLLHKVLALKQKYKIYINKELLGQIKVEDENNPKAVDVYVVKKGGVFPRPAFPSIDIMWQNWQ
jgi:hypothetical protein